MFKNLRNFLIVFLLGIAPALAVGEAFDQAKFDRLLKEGKPVLVSVHADWCPTCRTQDGFLQELLQTPPYNKLAVLRVDFDNQKDVLRKFNVRWQSTLIVFKNGKEVDRSTADTSKSSVAAMLQKVL